MAQLRDPGGKAFLLIAILLAVLTACGPRLQLLRTLLPM